MQNFCYRRDWYTVIKERINEISSKAQKKEKTANTKCSWQRNKADKWGNQPGSAPEQNH
jgi:hypothetical protein